VIAFPPKAFLDLAQSLAAGVDEAEHRTAAGRAYFAAHLAAADSLTNAGYLTLRQTWEDHGAVIAELKRHKAFGFKLGSMLSQLRDFRTSADYRIETAFEQSQARSAVQIAQAFFASLPGHSSL